MILLLIHPLTAVIIIMWMAFQHQYRVLSKDLKGEERINARNEHEAMGERILWATISTVVIAMVARIISGVIESGDPLSMIVPTSVHGWFGPIGLVIIWLHVKHGRKVRDAREANESFAGLKMKHGRAADIIMIIAMLHAFLGFLYIFDVIKFG